MNCLSNIQIEEILRPCQRFNGCFCKNELKKNCPDGYYVVNLDDSNKEGSHWVAFYKSDKIFIYWDSFGVLPPVEILKCINPKTKECIYNDFEIQDYHSSSCGYFCIAFVCCVNNLNSFQNFVNKFSAETKLNDSILYNILK